MVPAKLSRGLCAPGPSLSYEWAVVIGVLETSPGAGRHSRHSRTYHAIQLGATVLKGAKLAGDVRLVFPSEKPLRFSGRYRTRQM